MLCVGKFTKLLRQTIFKREEIILFVPILSNISSHFHTEECRREPSLRH